VHPPDPAPGQERIERVLGRVPRHVPAHEVAVAHALLEGALAERGVGDVARMQKGQLPNLPVVERVGRITGFSSDPITSASRGLSLFGSWVMAVSIRASVIG
jgi:hypothetical protein